MKSTIAILPLLFWSTFIFSQNGITKELEKLFEEQRYDEIIEKHAYDAKDYPARAVYFIGMAYYAKAEDNSCLLLMDLSIEKDSTQADPYYIKGMTYNYLGLHERAVSSFRAAVKLNPNIADFYIGLGDAHYNLKEYPEALSAYETAMQYPNPPERAFSMIPTIFNELNDSERALQASYVAKEHMKSKAGSYLQVLFNIGLYEYLNGNYAASEEAFKELLALNPLDYQATAKLIQVYYATGAFEQTKILKKQLYAGHKRRSLPDHMRDMFCFDQFEVNGKAVQAFERFEEPKDELYYKHLFYVLDEKQEIEFRVQTEYSVISQELGGPKYLLGMNKNGSHHSFSIGFDDGFEYPDLKRAVIQVIEEKVKPVTSFDPKR